MQNSRRETETTNELKEEVVRQRKKKKARMGMKSPTISGKRIESKDGDNAAEIRHVSESLSHCIF